MHGRPGQRHRHLPGVALGPVGPRLVTLGHLVEVVHADDPHVGTGRDALDAVLGLALLERPDPRPETDEELGHLHSRPLGGQVVTELVHEDHEHEGQDDDHPAQAGQQPERDDETDQADQPGPTLFDDLFVRLDRGWFDSVSFTHSPCHRSHAEWLRAPDGRTRVQHRHRWPSFQANGRGWLSTRRRCRANGAGPAGTPRRPPRWRR